MGRTGGRGQESRRKVWSEAETKRKSTTLATLKRILFLGLVRIQEKNKSAQQPPGRTPPGPLGEKKTEPRSVGAARQHVIVCVGRIERKAE